MHNRNTRLLGSDPDDIEVAAEILKGGGLVAFPTETVYGLGADASNKDAVMAVFEAKSRPAKNPLIVHVSDLRAAERLAQFGVNAASLAQAFWPGPLTLVLPKDESAKLPAEVSAGRPSIALRMPAHPVAQMLLQRVERPLAAPSANRSGKISPTKAEHVMEELEGRIDAVIDGGACEVGLESTIVGLVGEPALLRPGGLPAHAIEECLNVSLARSDEDQNAPEAPGMLASHYAPNSAVRLNATSARDDEVYLGFGRVADATLNLSPTGDFTEAAANLFAYLRELDDMEASAIAVSPIPELGLGIAINDRLRRAASPR